MAHITSDLIWQANQQAYSGIAEARCAGYAFTPVSMSTHSCVAFINGARSFENARQYA